jgi:hypothetical protein
LAIPSRRLEGSAVEDRGCDAIDDDSKETEHAKHFIHGSFADEPFFENVGEAIESCADEAEEVAFYLRGRVAAIRASDVVGCEEHAHAAAADQDTRNLGPFVSYVQEEEGDNYDADYGPEVEELSGEDVL